MHRPRRRRPIDEVRAHERTPIRRAHAQFEQQRARRVRCPTSSASSSGTGPRRGTYAGRAGPAQSRARAGGKGRRASGGTTPPRARVWARKSSRRPCAQARRAPARAPCARRLSTLFSRRGYEGGEGSVPLAMCSGSACAKRWVCSIEATCRACCASVGSSRKAYVWLCTSSARTYSCTFSAATSASLGTERLGEKGARSTRRRAPRGRARSAGCAGRTGRSPPHAAQRRGTRASPRRVFRTSSPNQRIHTLLKKGDAQDTQPNSPSTGPSRAPPYALPPIISKPHPPQSENEDAPGTYRYPPSGARTRVPFASVIALSADGGKRPCSAASAPANASSRAAARTRTVLASARPPTVPNWAMSEGAPGARYVRARCAPRLYDSTCAHNEY